MRKQQTSVGLKLRYKFRLLSDIKRWYSITEREVLSIRCCQGQLPSCIVGSFVLIEADHQPFSSMHKKHIYRNKQIEIWILILQSTSSSSLSQCFTCTSSTFSDLDCPLDSETWDPTVFLPIIIRFKARAVSLVQTFTHNLIIDDDDVYLDALPGSTIASDSCSTTASFLRITLLSIPI
jgi:hypothetical protein